MAAEDEDLDPGLPEVNCEYCMAKIMVIHEIQYPILCKSCAATRKPKEQYCKGACGSKLLNQYLWCSDCPSIQNGMDNGHGEGNDSKGTKGNRYLPRMSERAESSPEKLKGKDAIAWKRYMESIKKH
jgi:hypothetical protein